MLGPWLRSNGWVCLVSEQGASCHRGLLRQGIAWNFSGDSGHVSVYGLAGDDVTSVELRYGSQRRRAAFGENAFFVFRPVHITSIRQRIDLGELVIRYRSSRPPATVVLR